MTSPPWARRWFLGFIALLPGLLAAAPVRHVLESSMALHMLVELPLLALSGAATVRAWRGVTPAASSRWYPVDGDGLYAVAASLLAAALWMVPAALDATLLQPAVAWAKYISCWVTGTLFAASWPLMGGPMRLFLGGNLVWMFATAGLLYLDAEQRLCVNYRFDEQTITGIGLCSAAALVAAIAVWPASCRAAAALVSWVANPRRRSCADRA